MSRTNILIPPDGGNTYFAPISPAATSTPDILTKSSSSTLLEMLQKANKVQEISDVLVSGRKITKKPTLKDLGMGLFLTIQLNKRNLKNYKLVKNTIHILYNILSL